MEPSRCGYQTWLEVDSLGLHPDFQIFGQANDFVGLVLADRICSVAVSIGSIFDLALATAETTSPRNDDSSIGAGGDFS